MIKRSAARLTMPRLCKRRWHNNLRNLQDYVERSRNSNFWREKRISRRWNSVQGDEFYDSAFDNSLIISRNFFSLHFVQSNFCEPGFQQLLLHTCVWNRFSRSLRHFLTLIESLISVGRWLLISERVRYNSRVWS